jgi:hypothetical protein
VGGTFYDPTTGQFPAGYVGDYFFEDLTNGWIRVLDPTTRAVSPFASGANPLMVDLKVDPTGALDYLSRGSGTDTGAVYRISYAPPADAPYIQALYRDILGRTPAPAELAGWAQFQASGGTPSQIASAFVDSPEHRAQLIEQAYQAYLGRPPAPAEVGGWLAFLSASSTFERPLVDDILGSPEYRARQGQTDATFVAGLYRDLLGRAASPAETAGWLTVLEATPAASVADAFQGSSEYDAGLVAGWYRQYLGRAPSPAEVAGWGAALQAGLPLEQAIALFVTGPEYRADHADA